MNRIFSLLLAIMFVFSTSVVAQLSNKPAALSMLDSAELSGFFGKALHEGRAVEVVWERVKFLNKEAYPNPDLVLPHKVLEMPLGMTYTTQEGGTDHMWRASVDFVNVVLAPYMYGNYQKSSQTPGFKTYPVFTQSSPASVTQPVGGDIPLWLIFTALMFIVLGTGLWHLFIRDWVYPPFVKNPPERTDPQFVPTAQRVVEETFGVGTRIIGDIVDGVINGFQWMLSRNGSWGKHEFKKEPGFRATIEFPGGAQKVVHWRERCFNFVRSDVTDARELQGTFTPNGGTPEVISGISSDQRREFGTYVARGNQTPEVVFLLLSKAPKPEEQLPSAPPVIAEPKNEQPAVSLKEEEIMEAASFQFSLEKGVTFTGLKAKPKTVLGIMSHAAKLMKLNAVGGKTTGGEERKK